MHARPWGLAVFYAILWPDNAFGLSDPQDSAARPLSTFLDSDGGINDNDVREANSVAQTDPLNDGTWHQVILTPLAEGNGFQVWSVTVLLCLFIP
jgi:hypothetical protein